MGLLVDNSGPLGPERNDHQLKGEWKDFRECHIGGDFLLIYQIKKEDNGEETVIFVRAGSHNDLFGR